jgi:ribosomal protein S18 acetylase RimI-like enzyme
MARLYASTRTEELALVPWPEENKQAFLHAQFELQRDHYRKHYRHAEFLVIEHAGQPIGRLYLHPGAHEIRIMDITLLPAYRSQGIGTRLLDAMLAHAQARGAPVTLHVEPFNPAQRLYRRLGFRLLEDRGIYHFLEWRPDQLNTIS